MSKASEKIYVLHPTDGLLPNAMYGTAWLLPSGNRNEVEYIRKDALLEWLQPRAKELKQRWLANPADKEAFYKEQVFSSMIDHLNSL